MKVSKAKPPEQENCPQLRESPRLNLKTLIMEYSLDFHYLSLFPTCFMNCSRPKGYYDQVSTPGDWLNALVPTWSWA